MSGESKQQLWAVSNRLSLRAPQRESLEILDKVCELLPLTKDADSAQALEAIRSAFPSVTDFERDFASLCFALATGVGKASVSFVVQRAEKTRLVPFVPFAQRREYLHNTFRIREFTSLIMINDQEQHRKKNRAW